VSTDFALTKAVVAFSQRTRTTRTLLAGSSIEMIETAPLTGLVLIRFEGEDYLAFAADIESARGKPRNE